MYYHAHVSLLQLFYMLLFLCHEQTHAGSSASQCITKNHVVGEINNKFHLCTTPCTCFSTKYFMTKNHVVEEINK